MDSSPRQDTGSVANDIRSKSDSMDSIILSATRNVKLIPMNLTEQYTDSIMAALKENENDQTRVDKHQRV